MGGWTLPEDFAGELSRECKGPKRLLDADALFLPKRLRGKGDRPKGGTRKKRTVVPLSFSRKAQKHADRGEAIRCVRPYRGLDDACGLARPTTGN